MAADPTWTLVDAAEHAAADPRSLVVPEAHAREDLAPGDRARLLFSVGAPTPDEVAVAGERLWVEVTDRAPGGYVGRLADDPALVSDLSRGERIEFEPRHVVDLPGEADPWDGQAAFASERLFEDDDPGIGVATFDPGDAGRAIAGDRRLSGWSLLAGDETAADVDDPERIRLPGLSWMLRRHPELRTLLDGHDGSDGTWVRDDDGWRRA